MIADLTLLPESEDLIKSTPSTENNGNTGVIEGTKKARAVFQKTDVTDWKQLEAAFERATSEFGALDVVCPGAGIFEPVCLSSAYTLLPLNTLIPFKNRTRTG